MAAPQLAEPIQDQPRDPQSIRNGAPASGEAVAATRYSGAEPIDIRSRRRHTQPSGGARRPSIDAEAERRLLLEGAMAVLERSGWWGFKVESVLRQAGLSTRSFYRHFEKKNDLLMSLLESEVDRTATEIARVTEAAGTPSDGVRAYIGAMFDLAYHPKLAKRVVLFGSHWREMQLIYPERLHRCNQRMASPLKDVLREGKNCGEFCTEDPLATAKAVYCLITGMTTDQAIVGGTTSREELERIVMPFIGRAVGLDVPAATGRY